MRPYSVRPEKSSDCDKELPSPQDPALRQFQKVTLGPRKDHNKEPTVKGSSLRLTLYVFLLMMAYTHFFGQTSNGDLTPLLYYSTKL